MAPLRTRPSPILYERIAGELAGEIRSKRLAPFTKLPSEAELVERFGVSRVTVRQALRKLAGAGLVISRQGKGVFVAGAVVNQDLTALRGFYDNLVMQGHHPVSTVVGFECLRASAAAPELKRLEHDLYRVRRLWRVGDLPLAVADASIPGAGKVVTREDVERLPVYSIVREVIGREVVRASVQVRAARCAPDVTRLLNIARDATILEMERTSYDRQGLAVEMTRFSVPAELFAFQMEVAGPLQIASSIKRIEPDPKMSTRQRGKRK